MQRETQQKSIYCPRFEWNVVQFFNHFKNVCVLTKYNENDSR